MTVDPRMHMHHQPGPCIHTSFTWKGRMPCLALGTSAHPGWLPGPQAPELVPWARGAAESGHLWGNTGVNGKRPLPPQPGQEAQSHGGGGGPLPPGRPQGCGGPRAPRAQQQKLRGNWPCNGGEAWSTQGRGHTALGGAYGPDTSFTAMKYGPAVKAGLSGDRF